MLLHDCPITVQSLPKPEPIRVKPKRTLPEALRRNIFRKGDPRLKELQARAIASMKAKRERAESVAAQVADPNKVIRDIGLEQMRLIGRRLAAPNLTPQNRRTLLATLRDIRAMLKEDEPKPEPARSRLEPLPDTKPTQ